MTYGQPPYYNINILPCIPDCDSVVTYQDLINYVAEAVSSGITVSGTTTSGEEIIAWVMSQDYATLNQLSTTSGALCIWVSNQDYITSPFLTTVSGDIINQIPFIDLQNVSVDILPEMTGSSGSVSMIDLGSATKKFRTIYVHDVMADAGSIYVNGKKVIEDVSDTITVSTDPDQDLAIRTYNTGDIKLLSQNGIVNQGQGGVSIEVPSTKNFKNLSIDNYSSGGNVGFSAAGFDGTILFLSYGDVDFLAERVVLDADLTVTGTITRNGILVADVNLVNTVSGHVVAQIPSLVGYATENYVQSNFVSTVDLTTVSGDLVTQMGVGNVTGEMLLTTSGDLVSQIPSLIGYVTEAYVSSNFVDTNSMTTISGDLVSQMTSIGITQEVLDTTSGNIVSQIPSLLGYATQYYVTENYVSQDGFTTVSGDIVSQIPDLSGYATESGVDYLLSTVSGGIVAAIPVVGGSSKGIQYHNGTTFGSDWRLTWDYTTYRLGVGLSAPLYPVHVNQNANDLACVISNGGKSWVETGANPRGRGLLVCTNRGDYNLSVATNNYGTYGIINLVGHRDGGSYQTVGFYNFVENPSHSDTWGDLISVSGSTSSPNSKTYGLQIKTVRGGNQNYGLYISQVGASISGEVTNHAIYSNTTAPIYFSGNLGIGNDNPQEKLTISGGLCMMSTVTSVLESKIPPSNNVYIFATYSGTSDTTQLRAKFPNGVVTDIATSDGNPTYSTIDQLTATSGSLLTTISNEYVSRDYMTTISGDLYTQIPSLSSYISDSQMTTISGDLVAQIGVGGVTQEQLTTTSGDILSQIFQVTSSGIQTTEVFSIDLTNTSYDVQDVSYRLVVPFTVAGSQVRVKFKSPETGFFEMSHASIGTQSSGVCTQSTPVELTFDGLSGLTLSGGVMGDSLLAMSNTLDGDFSGFPGYSIRHVVPFGSGGTQVRVKFRAPNSGTLAFKHASIGKQTTDINTESTPVELKFGGSSGMSISNGETIWSDWTDFSSSGGQNQIVVYDCSDSYGDIRYTATTTLQRYYAVGESWNSASPAGFSGPATYNYSIDSVEVRSFTAGNTEVWSDWVGFDSIVGNQVIILDVAPTNSGIAWVSTTTAERWVSDGSPSETWDLADVTNFNVNGDPDYCEAFSSIEVISDTQTIGINLVTQQQLTTVSGDLVAQLPVFTVGSGMFISSGATITHNLGQINHFTQVTPTLSNSSDLSNVGTVGVIRGDNVDTVYTSGGVTSDGLSFMWMVSLP